ncbi:MAG: putative transposase [Candidatus Azotimanducaceae bacterium]
MFVAQHKRTCPAVLMCRLPGVKGNGYYGYWKRRGNAPENPKHQKMLEAMKEVAIDSDSTYVSGRMKVALNVLAYPISRNKASKLMEKANVRVRCRNKFKVTTDSNHELPLFDNVLNRELEVDQPDRVYVGDITYLWTQEGWFYLAVVIDLFSRRVVGWSMSSRIKADIVRDALQMARWQRQPKAGLIVHSDRDSQYASKAYRRLLQTNGFV